MLIFGLGALALAARSQAPGVNSGTPKTLRLRFRLVECGSRLHKPEVRAKALARPFRLPLHKPEAPAKALARPSLASLQA